MSEPKIAGAANYILTKIDQMHAASEAGAATPPPATVPGETEPPVERAKTGVLFCKRDAQVPGNVIHAKHHWLKTSTREAGMGAEGGGVPGGKPDVPGVRTTVNEHAGESREPGAECVPVMHVDEACVNEELEIGRHTGRWLPGNNCQTFVKEVIARCPADGPPVPESAPDPRWLESKGIAEEH